MKTPTLETDRLVLRPISLDDAPAIQKHFNNWEIIQHLGLAVPWPYPNDGAETWIRDAMLPKIKNGDTHAWVLTEREGDQQAIGVLHYRKELESAGNRGFWLAVPYQGKGYMTEAVTALNDFLFFELGVKRYEVCNAKSNIASRRVKEKTGAIFVRYGNCPHHSGDKTSEHWEITYENWAKIRGRD